MYRYLSIVDRPCLSLCWSLEIILSLQCILLPTAGLEPQKFTWAVKKDIFWQLVLRHTVFLFSNKNLYLVRNSCIVCFIQVGRKVYRWKLFLLSSIVYLTEVVKLYCRAIFLLLGWLTFENVFWTSVWVSLAPNNWLSFFFGKKGEKALTRSKLIKWTIVPEAQILLTRSTRLTLNY